jgi:hypothetical protein
VSLIGFTPEQEVAQVARAVVEVAEAVGITGGEGVDYCRRLIAAHEARERGLQAGEKAVHPERKKTRVEQLRLTRAPDQLEHDARRGDGAARGELAQLRKAEDADRAEAASPPPSRAA